MNTNQLYQTFSIKTYEDGSLKSSSAELVCEKELTVLLNETPISTITCSPGADAEMAVGFLLSERHMPRDSKLERIICSDNDMISIITSNPIPKPPVEQIENSSTHQIAGIPVKTKPPAIPDEAKIRFYSSHLLELINKLDNQSFTFKKTGGVHSVALGDSNGMIIRYEDIGRHNAVDKVVGYAFLNDIPLHDKCLILSGRVASEILAKAAVNGIPVVLSRSAPTLQAVKLAEELGLTIVGFARGNRFNVYTHWARIIEQ